MSTKTIKGNITISRPSGYGEGKIRVRIRDEAAAVQFVELEMDLSEFAKAITGAGFVDCEIEVRHLDRIGKKQERQQVEFEIPETDLHEDRKSVAAEVARKVCPDGWVADIRFNSQNSFFLGDNGKQMARCNIRRWVDRNEDE